MTPKACPGMVLGDLGAPFGVRRVIFKEFLRRLARRWAQDGRSWGQVGSKLRPRWAKIVAKKRLEAGTMLKTTLGTTDPGPGDGEGGG